MIIKCIVLGYIPIFTLLYNNLTEDFAYMFLIGTANTIDFSKPKAVALFAH